MSRIVVEFYIDDENSTESDPWDILDIIMNEELRPDKTFHFNLTSASVRGHIRSLEINDD